MAVGWCACRGDDAATGPVEAALRGKGEALVILEGAHLPTRSRLRASLEKAADTAVIACYPEEGRALEATIQAALQAEGIGSEPEALAWLASRLGADRASTRAELEKLVLYVGQGGRLDTEAAAACVGDLAGLSLDDALFAATAGDVALADRALELALAEGETPVGVIRAALGHMNRLHRARLAVDEGAQSCGCGQGGEATGFLSSCECIQPRARALAGCIPGGRHGGTGGG